jgi:hypothetical protein
MYTLQALEAQNILLLRGESMIFMFLKETVINCSVGNILNASETSLSKRVLASLPASKANL